jgi:hypothetical protein
MLKIVLKFLGIWHIINALTSIVGAEFSRPQRD